MTTQLTKSTSRDNIWCMIGEDGYSSCPNKPSMILEQTYNESRVPITRTWTIMDQFTGEITQRFTIRYPCKKPAQVARDLELSWQLYSTSHVDVTRVGEAWVPCAAATVNTLLLNTPLTIAFSEPTFGALWTDLVCADANGKHSYASGDRFVVSGDIVRFVVPQVKSKNKNTTRVKEATTIGKMKRKINSEKA